MWPMDTMKQDEVQQLLSDNPHLKEYLDSIQSKMGRPVFYSKVPREIVDEAYPNIIYPTKGVVFIHIYRTQDMD